MKSEDARAAAAERYLAEAEAALAGSPADARGQATEDIREWLAEWQAETGLFRARSAEEEFDRLCARFGRPGAAAEHYVDPAASHAGRFPWCRGRNRLSNGLIAAGLLTAGLLLTHGPAWSGESPPKASPFTAVVFGEGDAIHVRYEGRDYRWSAINDVPVSEVAAFARKTYGDRWQKRIAEDLPELMGLMGKPPGRTVSLRLIGEAGTPVDVDDAAMTDANRRAIWDARNGTTLATMPKTDPKRVGGYDRRLSPFTAVRFEEGRVNVDYDGRPFRWDAIDGLEVGEIVAFAKSAYDDRWQKRVAEDLVEVLNAMGREPGDTVSLKLSAADGESVSVEAAELTVMNRQAVRNAGAW